MESPNRSIYSGPKVRNISLIVVIAKPPHGGVYDLCGIFGSLLGQVEIEHCGFKLAMSHVLLNDPGIYTGLQQVGCIAVAKGMYRNAAFGNAGGVRGLSEGALNTGGGHGVFGCVALVSPSAKGRKNEDWISVGSPIAAQQLIGFIGDRNIAILGAFSVVDMDHFSSAVDVRDLEGKGLRDPQATGIDG